PTGRETDRPAVVLSKEDEPPFATTELGPGLVPRLVPEVVRAHLGLELPPQLVEDVVVVFSRRADGHGSRSASSGPRDSGTVRSARRTCASRRHHHRTRRQPCAGRGRRRATPRAGRDGGRGTSRPST